MAWMQGQSLRDVFIVLLMLHTMVSGKAFSFFRCQKVENVWYLMADYREECYDSSWWTMFIFVLFVVLSFSLGVPGAVAYTLHKRRISLEEPETKQFFGVLYR